MTRMTGKRININSIKYHLTEYLKENFIISSICFIIGLKIVKINVQVGEPNLNA